MAYPDDGDEGLGMAYLLWSWSLRRGGGGCRHLPTQQPGLDKCTMRQLVMPCTMRHSVIRQGTRLTGCLVAVASIGRMTDDVAYEPDWPDAPVNSSCTEPMMGRKGGAWGWRVAVRRVYVVVPSNNGGQGDS